MTGIYIVTYNKVRSRRQILAGFEFLHAEGCSHMVLCWFVYNAPHRINHLKLISSFSAVWPQCWVHSLDQCIPLMLGIYKDSDRVRNALFLCDLEWPVVVQNLRGKLHFTSRRSLSIDCKSLLSLYCYLDRTYVVFNIMPFACKPWVKISFGPLQSQF